MNLINKIFKLGINKQWNELNKLYIQLGFPEYNIIDVSKDLFNRFKKQKKLYLLIDIKESNISNELAAFLKYYPYMKGWYE